MKITFWISLCSAMITLSCKAQTETQAKTTALEFTCDQQKFDVKGYAFLDVDYPKDSRITHYYWKKIGDKISIKSFLLIDGKIDRWATYDIRKNFFKGLERKDFLTTFPPMSDVEDEADIISYTIAVDKEYTSDLIYGQYWCGWDNSLMTDYEWGNIDFTFSTKAATEKFLNLLGK